MVFDALDDLNWLAVVVATVAYMALGALWYQPFAFGRAWADAAGVPMPEEGDAPSPLIYVGALVAYFGATVATALLARATGSESFADGVAIGLVVGVGYSVTFTLVGATFEAKPKRATWFAITAAFNLLALLVVGVIVTTWD